MTKYFPKHSVQWHFEEPTVLRRFSLSLVEMALLTGVLMRLYRALLVPAGSASSWLWAGGTYAFGLLVLCAAVTIHLANYPVYRWLWRAPLFVVVEVAAEMATSLVLIWLRREPIGSARAEWGDWPGMVGTTLVTRLVTVGGWALILAGVVWIVRRTVLRDERVEEDPEPTEDTAPANPL
jgi:hypothetical protein